MISGIEKNTIMRIVATLTELPEFSEAIEREEVG